MIDMELLRSYENGPRIWDAAAIHPKVMELSDAGLIEPVTGNSAWKITQAGLDALEAYDELGPTTVQAGHNVYIEGTDAYDFHNAIAEMIERREPFTILAGDGRPLARVEPIPAASRPRPVTLDDLVPAVGVELKGDCALWNDGEFGVVLGPYVTGSVRVRVEHSGIIVQARPENIRRLVPHP
jgi:hypothetical protein